MQNPGLTVAGDHLPILPCQSRLIDQTQRFVGGHDLDLTIALLKRGAQGARDLMAVP